MQCASLVQCYSTAIYAQVYPRFSRLECRAFLSEAVQYFGGAAQRCMVDNTSVIIAHGTGKDAQAADCMRALAERFGFYFEAHAVGMPIDRLMWSAASIASSTTFILAANLST